ncbi:esterase-like activity of phytase family protein [Sphingomonas solaris]|uniref:Esterase-like activity of phytase family protein n=1 Tax=Alterirhizorhabdus solaris TaxID=2529389 RepID=A0A558RC09_9SPHN|nr:esterase-like activity of phytase family protein [Sphingomonas solaris]TVV76916.1 esterase-like activity of phytase family protein [Sphingomonas solaris]
MSKARVTELAYSDEELACLDLPGGKLRVTRGIGSGLTRRAGDADGIVWAVGDRGPNLKLPLAIERYGLDHLAAHTGKSGAKLMPYPSIGPAIVELHVGDRHVTAIRTLALRDVAGTALSGLPPAGTDARAAEPALDLNGEVLPPDPGGADTEGLTGTPDGGFWVGEEYGPSLLRLDPDGSVRVRWVPAGTEASFAGANYPVVGALPQLAAYRRLNRGFEGLTLSMDGQRLHVAFQSPLAHPDEHAGDHARHVRLWTLDTTTGALLTEHLYPLDKPKSFLRDNALSDVDRADVKLCDVAMLDANTLIVLERISATAKLYLTRLDPERALAPKWSDPATRPTIEELSAGDAPGFPCLDKHLLFSTDDHPEISPDLEGLTLLDERTILLVNDNDFGIEGVPTRFWRVEMKRPIGCD